MIEEPWPLDLGVAGAELIDTHRELPAVEARLAEAVTEEARSVATS